MTPRVSGKETHAVEGVDELGEVGRGLGLREAFAEELRVRNRRQQRRVDQRQLPAHLCVASHQLLRAPTGKEGGNRAPSAE